MKMHLTMRWFGPNDPVSLADIRQAGCHGVVTALHQFAPGEVWSRAEVAARKGMIEAAGMRWSVVESLPVSEAIKQQGPDYLLHIENYKQSLRNIAAEGLEVVTYNFMPVLDWVRTDPAYPLDDGSRALRFDRLDFIASDLFILERPGAADEYDPATKQLAAARYALYPASQRKRLLQHMMLGLPGANEDFTPAQVLTSLKAYTGIDAATLKIHLYSFLRAVVPIAAYCNLKLAIHPDDPPFPILGLPRIVSTEQDIAEILDAVPSFANGLCFCTGSLGARPDNNSLEMLRRFSDRVHFLHLRNTSCDAAGNFYEADHLSGDTDMFEIMTEILSIQARRKISLPMRPDHGHQMLDDLTKNTYPGYTAIGRLKGLAELRGLEHAIHCSEQDLKPEI